jgi:hypothetical protein
LPAFPLFRFNSDMAQTQPPHLTYVVEHLDPELGPWSSLEYGCIARETYSAGAKFLLTSVPESLQMPDELTSLEGLRVERRSVEEIFADRKPKVCLLDPAAKEELQPADGDFFEIFLFGGILGTISKLYIEILPIRNSPTIEWRATRTLIFWRVLTFK